MNLVVCNKHFVSCFLILIIAFNKVSIVQSTTLNNNVEEVKSKTTSLLSSHLPVEPDTSENRLIIQGPSYTINLIPIFLLFKIILLVGWFISSEEEYYEEEQPYLPNFSDYEYNSNSHNHYNTPQTHYTSPTVSSYSESPFEYINQFRRKDIEDFAINVLTKTAEAFATVAELGVDALKNYLEKLKEAKEPDTISVKDIYGNDITNQVIIVDGKYPEDNPNNYHQRPEYDNYDYDESAYKNNEINNYNNEYLRENNNNYNHDNNHYSNGNLNNYNNDYPRQNEEFGYGQNQPQQFDNYFYENNYYNYRREDNGVSYVYPQGNQVVPTTTATTTSSTTKSTPVYTNIQKPVFNGNSEWTPKIFTPTTTINPLKRDYFQPINLFKPTQSEPFFPQGKVTFKHPTNVLDKNNNQILSGFKSVDVEIPKEEPQTSIMDPIANPKEDSSWFEEDIIIPKGRVDSIQDILNERSSSISKSEEELSKENNYWPENFFEPPKGFGEKFPATMQKLLHENDRESFPKANLDIANHLWSKITKTNIESNAVSPEYVPPKSFDQ